MKTTLLCKTVGSFALLAFLCGGLAVVVTAAMAQGTSLPETTIRLDPHRDRGAISPLIYGTNHRYNGDATGTWDADNKQMLPAFDHNHREAALRSIRYPGGTVASTFEWKKSIGPIELRRPMQPAKGEPQIVSFGVDEAARWCAANGVELVYMYGIGAPNSNPQDAADLVEYLNAPVGQNRDNGVDWARRRAENGHPAPYNIRFFEIANEADGPNTVQRFWLNAVDTDENRAKRKLPLQPQRDSYAPEYCFGGIIRLDRQPIAEHDDFRESAARSNGQPNQRKMIRYFPIVPESETVFVGKQTWTRVPDIQKATGQAYQIDVTTGTVRFGDGIKGDIPPAGTDISVSYRARRAGFVDYYPAMKAVDPTLRIFAGYESPNIITALGDQHLYDGIVVHPYSNEYNVPRARTLDEWHHHLMLSSARLGHEIRAYQDLIDATVAPSRRGQVKVICTEYGPNRQEQVLPESAANKATYRFLTAGLYNATQLLQWMRLGMPHAQRHATTVGVFGPAPDFEPSPTALAFQLFTRHFGDRLIGIELQNNPLRSTDTIQTGSKYHGAIKRYDAPNSPPEAARLQLPRLEAEASRDAAGNVYLMIINQDANDDVTVNIRIDPLTASGDAELWTLNGPSATAFNTPTNPNAVTITPSRAHFQGGTLHRVFPAHSLTAVKFPAEP